MLCRLFCGEGKLALDLATSPSVCAPVGEAAENLRLPLVLFAAFNLTNYNKYYIILY